MRKLSGPKLIILIVVAVVVVGAVAAAVIIFLRKPESYRMIKIVALDGTATIQRESVGDIDAYIGMNLQSGDRMRLNETSTTTIMLDDDKYILLEPGTVLTVEAYGNKKNNQTTINLECGAILNTITSSLSENSSYVVNVPNAVMAVRGTCYRISVQKTGDDKYEIGLEVFSGEVESQLFDSNGKPTGEIKLHEKNTSTIIVSDNKESDGKGKAYYLVIDGEIDFDSLPTETVNMIMDIYYSGHAPLQDAVSMLIRHNNKDAVEYVKNHEYAPTGTLTGTAPDLGELTATESGNSAHDGNKPADGTSAPEDNTQEPVGSDGTGVANEPTDNPDTPDNPDNPDVANDTSTVPAAVTTVPNSPEGSDSNAAPQSSQSVDGAVTTTAAPAYDFTSDILPAMTNLPMQNNPQQPNVPTATPSYTVVFLDPDGVVID